MCAGCARGSAWHQPAPGDGEPVGFVLSYWRLVIALGSTPHMPPIPGLGVHALTLKDMSDAVHLRNHVLRRLDLAESDGRQAARQLTFVFVGAGYAGVEALAETRQLVRDALPHYPALRGVRRRWVLVERRRGSWPRCRTSSPATPATCCSRTA